MPELPEVETTRRGINPYLAGRTITGLEVRQPKLRWPVETELSQALKGLTLGDIERRAKYLIFPLLKNNQTANWGLLWHLGMSGSLRLVEPSTPWNKHDHIQLEVAPLEKGSEQLFLRYQDPRRFGFLLSYEGEPSSHKLLAHLGPEPLSDDFNAAYLAKQAKNKRQAIKVFLMNNQQVVGVGNIYANEALFKAGIHPKRPAGSLNLAEHELLVAEIKSILAASIKQGGTTLQDFVGGDGQPGYFAQHLNVYGRAGKDCFVCATPLETTKLAQRATTWCPNCQS